MTFLLSFSLVPDSSLFFFFGGGFGFGSLAFDEFSGSSFKKGLVLIATEFAVLGESLTLSGLSSPNTCGKCTV